MSWETLKYLKRIFHVGCTRLRRLFVSIESVDNSFLLRFIYLHTYIQYKEFINLICQGLGNYFCTCLFLIKPKFRESVAYNRLVII